MLNRTESASVMYPVLINTIRELKSIIINFIYTNKKLTAYSKLNLIIHITADILIRMKKRRKSTT